MSQDFLMHILEEEALDDSLTQLNKVPLNFKRMLPDLLFLKFPEKWFGRGAPITWPPCSPNLTPTAYLFIFGVYQGILCMWQHWLPLCQNLLGRCEFQ
jgi:hypothetical protein